MRCNFTTGGGQPLLQTELALCVPPHCATTLLCSDQNILHSVGIQHILQTRSGSILLLLLLGVLAILQLLSKGGEGAHERGAAVSSAARCSGGMSRLGSRRR